MCLLLTGQLTISGSVLIRNEKKDKNKKESKTTKTTTNTWPLEHVQRLVWAAVRCLEEASRKNLSVREGKVNYLMLK